MKFGKNIFKYLSLFFAILMLSNGAISQNFITGADLSYTNTILNKGGIYRDTTGKIVDPFEFFSQQGAKMVRLRLWHTPENITDIKGNPITSSDINDVLLAAQKVKKNGMSINLAIHYGDYFNDPATQLRPDAWTGLSHEILLDSIYLYSYHVLELLNAQNTLPEIVSIGNETTNGFIDESVPTDGFFWPEDAEKFNAGLDAVDDFNKANSKNVLKAIHLTEETAKWTMGEFNKHGISNFDVLGVSYYPFFSPNSSLEDVGKLIKELKEDYGKQVMLFETGFIWTQENGDSYNNFIGNNGNKLGYPISAEGQKDFLLDLSQVVSENGGIGILYWEAGWISSGMYDKWGQGSSYENAGFFDFNKQNNPLKAFKFFQFNNKISVD